ncbi:MAG: iron ABC transporter permease, partial [Cyclobacteriaceae bacterium]|nr:iron ABC transporter permease [Cyclobacteriaceae bacterium]
MPNRITLLLLLSLLFLLALTDLWMGTVNISPLDWPSILMGRDDHPGWRDILVEIRLPRVLTGILAGAGLAVSGLLMQSLFRNPLAGPDVLGISSGAGLMVALVVLGGMSLGSAYWTTALAA